VAVQLDLGCGAGVPVTQWLARRFLVMGVDVSASQVELGREHVPQATFMQASMTTVAFPSDLRRDRRVLLDHPCPSARPSGVAHRITTGCGRTACSWLRGRSTRGRARRRTGRGGGADVVESLRRRDESAHAPPGRVSHRVRRDAYERHGNVAVGNRSRLSPVRPLPRDADRGRRDACPSALDLLHNYRHAL
jgi:SAM-dependent methyltransferase